MCLCSLRFYSTSEIIRLSSLYCLSLADALASFLYLLFSITSIAFELCNGVVIYRIGVRANREINRTMGNGTEF